MLDAETGLRTISLYGERLMPTREDLVDVDVGLVVLDRPNPLGGILAHAEGPIREPSCRSFVGEDAIPVRHALTIGELARLWQREQFPHAPLDVIASAGCTRDMHWPETRHGNTLSTRRRTVAGRRPCLRRTRLHHAHALNQVRVRRLPDCRQPGRLRALRAIDRPTGYSPRTRARSQHRDRRAHWSVGRERRLGLPGRIGRVVPLTNLASTAPRLRHSLPTDLSVGAARSTVRSAPPHLHFPPKHLANPLEPTCRR